MNKYCLIQNQPLVFIKFMAAPTDTRQGYSIVPYTKLAEPTYDRETQKISPLREVTLEGVTDGWTVGDLTEGELKQKTFQRAVATGFDTGLGYSLKISDYDRTQFTQLLAAVNEFLSAGAMTLNSPVDIWDTEGEKHTVTVTVFKQLIMGLSLYYMQINAAK